MANTRRQPPEKISADCPHCGFSQLEAALAKSTYCRKCGEYYSIEKLLAKEAGSLKAPSFFDRISKMVSRETTRDISCFSCGATQQVSSAAESTQCPKCSSYIDLRDFKIAGAFGRSIQTQGDVIISSKGDVTSQRILCGGAVIEGKMRGQMVCTGTVTVKAWDKVLGGIEAQKIVIDKKCQVEFSKPLKSPDIEINGKVTAHIQCDGRVTVQKKGWLMGSVHAKSIVVEKGGIFSGDLFIGQVEELENEAHEEAARQAAAAAESESHGMDQAPAVEAIPIEIPPSQPDAAIAPPATEQPQQEDLFKPPGARPPRKRARAV